VIRFFGKLTFGHFRRDRLEALLCLIGVALGVAVVVGIDSAVAACVRSFGGAVQTLAQRSTHSIFAEAGSIPDSVYIDLLKKKLSVPLAPVIDRRVLISVKGKPTTLARLLGMDVFSERLLRSFTSMQSSLDQEAFHAFLTQPNQVVLVDELAKQLNVKSDSMLELTAGGKRVAVHVIGIVEPSGVARSQLSDLIIVDLATAQELTDSIGRIDRIDTILDKPEQEKDLEAALPAGFVLRSTQQRSASLEQLIQSYRLNLNALSLMASFVAVFIVYNSMLISVRQRGTSLGILRCLGGSRRQLGGLYVTEAILFSLIGGVIGVFGGWMLSRVLVGYVATTINDLYASLRPGPVALDATMWAKGMTVSIVSCLIGAIVPLYAASRTPPINAFRGTQSQRASRWAAARLLVVGVLLVMISYGVYLLPGDSPIAGFAMAFLTAVGFALMCPWITKAGCKLVDAGARWLQLLPLQMAASGVARSLGITGVAVAATMLAMAMNIGIRTMVSSFRGSLADWLGQRFAADVFIGPELLVNHKTDATLDPAVEKWVLAQPEVRRVIEYRAIDIPLGGKPTLLTGTDPAEVLRTLPMKYLAVAGATFDPKNDALVSEPLAGRMKISAGEMLTVPSPTGLHRFHVYGIFYDFGTERGQLMLDRQTFAADWLDDRVNSLHVSLKPGVDRSAIAAKWSQELRENYPVVVDSFDGVKLHAMTVFDRTFKVTVVLTWLSGGVAFCGLAGSLLALALARQRDYSILAAVGMSGQQTGVWVLSQGMLIAWASAVVAPVAGTILAYVLAYVIQYRSFGWSIPTHPQPSFWIQNFWLATAAALVAAIYPIYRLRSTPPAASLQAE
jgi:putative ABC transport system permease protein